MGPIEARTPQAAASALTPVEPAAALAPAAPAHPMPIATVGRVGASPAAPTAGPPPLVRDADPLARLQRRTTAPLTIRRTPDWKNGRHQDDALDSFVSAADDLMTEGAKVALTRFNDLTAPDGYTARWKSTALRMILGRESRNPLLLRFGAARYGYAIESYVTQHLPSIASKLPRGLRYATQVGRGSTRPDILVLDQSDRDVGWFDITSERSKGHIYKKFSTGWKTKPYVTELLYPNFDLSRLSPGNASEEEIEAARVTYQANQQEWQSFLDECRVDFDEAYANLSTELGKAYPSQTDKQGMAREALADCLDLDPGELPPDQCKGLLRAFGHLPKNFGWKSGGGSKNSGLALLRGHFDARGAEEEPSETGEDGQDDTDEAMDQ